MTTGFVYLWTNAINQKKYLGSHIGTPDDGYTGSGVAFQRAVRKYGLEKFSRVLLETNIPEDQVRLREQHYLDLYNAASSKEFYNLAHQADGGFRHVNESPHKAVYQAKALAGFRKMLDEKGHPKGMAGKKHSVETKLRMATNIRKSLVALKGRAVIKYDLASREVARFESITDAANSVNGSPSNIKYTCEGKFKKAYGYKWSYVDKPE